MRRYFVYTFKYLPLMMVLLIITACESIAPTPTPTPTQTLLLTSTPFPEIDLDVELPDGNAEAGYLIAIRYRCHGCHVNEEHPTYGPRFTSEGEMPFVLERGFLRLALSEYEGRATNNQEYMIESIFQPEAYNVPGEWKESMPTNFQQRMTDQELADILAWIATLEVAQIDN